MKREKKITIKEIAKMSGVSICTVSRVINNNGYVSEATRKAVEKCLQDTNFHPSITAQSMIYKKSNIVGIIVSEINNPFISDLVVLIEKSLNLKGLSIMLCNSQYNQRKVANFANEMISRNAEALIFIGLDFTDKNLIQQMEKYISVICVNSKIGEFDSVNFTDWQSSYEMTEHLISMGHEKIAFIGHDENSSPTLNRLNGYKAAMKKAGLKIPEAYILSAITGSSIKAINGYDLALSLIDLENPPTAIFAVNDFYAISCFVAAKERGLLVGKDISVVGFDDMYLAQLLNPPITTVRFNIRLLAEMTTNLLFTHLSETTEKNHMLIPGEIIYRESVKKMK